MLGVTGCPGETEEGGGNGANPTISPSPAGGAANPPGSATNPAKGPQAAGKTASQEKAEIDAGLIAKCSDISFPENCTKDSGVTGEAVSDTATEEVHCYWDAAAGCVWEASPEEKEKRDIVGGRINTCRDIKVAQANCEPEGGRVRFKSGLVACEWKEGHRPPCEEKKSKPVGQKDSCPELDEASCNADALDTRGEPMPCGIDENFKSRPCMKASEVGSLMPGSCTERSLQACEMRTSAASGAAPLQCEKQGSDCVERKLGLYDSCSQYKATAADCSADTRAKDGRVLNCTINAHYKDGGRCVENIAANTNKPDDCTLRAIASCRDEVKDDKYSKCRVNKKKTRCKKNDSYKAAPSATASASASSPGGGATPAPGAGTATGATAPRGAPGARGAPAPSPPLATAPTPAAAPAPVRPTAPVAPAPAAAGVGVGTGAASAGTRCVLRTMKELDESCSRGLVEQKRGSLATIIPKNDFFTKNYCQSKVLRRGHYIIKRGPELKGAAIKAAQDAKTELSRSNRPIDKSVGEELTSICGRTDLPADCRVEMPLQDKKKITITRTVNTGLFCKPISSPAPGAATPRTP
jgi:hypothetical protein